jgi:glycosyltransferase involved in cell wall biosynthesis
MSGLSRVLVRHVSDRIAMGGGPYGYLFELREALALDQASGGAQIVVEERPQLARSPLVASEPASAGRRLLARALYKLQRYRASEFAMRLRAEMRSESAKWQIDRAAAEELFACDVLFVHETFLAEHLVKVDPANARRKLVLMTHAPTFYVEQWAAAVRPDVAGEDLRQERCVREHIAHELEVMRSVRAVAWPAAEAQEGYPEWQHLYRKGSVSSVFVSSGLASPVPKASAAEVRQRWRIGSESQVVLFMGRPHPHKGFDRFAAWAAASKVRQSRLIFVFAGPEPHWPGLDTSSVVRIGFERDPAAAYRAADLVVLPNRVAYFDLGLIQCLSLGVPLALSPVGGHRAVTKLCPEIPVLAAADPMVVVDELRMFLADDGAREACRTAGAALWSARYSPIPFVAGHRAVAAEILGLGRSVP